MRGQLDAILAVCLARPVEALDPAVLDALRLGAYQLVHTRIPPHAAVSATIDTVRAVVRPAAIGLLNAVLRRVSERDLAGWLALIAPSPDADPVGYLAAVTSHPRWVVEGVLDALAGDVEETRRALDANNERPAVHLVARPGRISRDELLAHAGAAAAPGPWSPYAVHLAAGDPAGISAVRDGRVGVQDEGSQLAALALTRPQVDGPDSTWVDMCAGPGGKAALLSGVAAARCSEAEQAANQAPIGLLALERAPHRARLVADALRGASGSHLLAVADARTVLATATADRILVDAPCSGLGALRRRPEARWRRTPDDLNDLGVLQRQLLTAALRATRPGGVVAYVTCSPHPAETTAVVTDALAHASASRPGTALLDAHDALPELPRTGPGPTVQLWPHRHGTDAMFIALLRVGAARPGAT
jgi:16S rRNA (cytosine967-C5)-methyltransferase